MKKQYHLLLQFNFISERYVCCSQEYSTTLQMAQIYHPNTNTNMNPNKNTNMSQCPVNGHSLALSLISEVSAWETSRFDSTLKIAKHLLLPRCHSSFWCMRCMRSYLILMHTPFYLVYGAAWETYGHNAIKKQNPGPVKNSANFLSSENRAFFTRFQ